MLEPETLKATSLSIQYGLIFCILMQKITVLAHRKKAWYKGWS